MSDDTSGAILWLVLKVIIVVSIVAAAWYALTMECFRLHPHAAWWYCWF